MELARKLTAAYAQNRLAHALKTLTQPRLLIIDEIGYLGLDATQASLLFQVICQRYERNHAVVLTSNKGEYSLWTREPEQDILPTLEELGIGFVPYSPLGRGFLTGKIDESTTSERGDFRNAAPRFTPAARQANLALVGLLGETATKKESSPARIALAITAMLAK